MTKVLINIEYEVPVGYGERTVDISFIWPKELYEELRAFLAKYPEEELWYSGLYGKHSQKSVAYKEILEGVTLVEDAEKIKEFQLMYGNERDVSEICDAYGMFIEQIASKQKELEGEMPSWWHYDPDNEEELKQEKWDEVKKELNQAAACLADFAIFLSDEEKKNFQTYLDNNELELARDELRGKFLQVSSFSKHMTRAANLMQLPALLYTD